MRKLFCCCESFLGQLLDFVPLIKQQHMCQLTHCILVDSSTSPFAILGVSCLFRHFKSIFDGISCLQTV